jgi:hypothetical protein
MNAVPAGLSEKNHYWRVPVGSVMRLQRARKVALIRKPELALNPGARLAICRVQPDDFPNQAKPEANAPVLLIVPPTLNRPGFVGDFILWKRGWSHGQKRENWSEVFG